MRIAQWSADLPHSFRPSKISHSCASNTSTAAQPSFGLPSPRNRKRHAVSVVGGSEQFQRGNFLDVKTLAAALTSKSHPLETLADYLGVKHKGKFTDFARPIDAEFIDYAVNDVETTRQCFEELVRRYQKHRLGVTAPQAIYSWPQPPPQNTTRPSAPSTNASSTQAKSLSSPSPQSCENSSSSLTPN